MVFRMRMTILAYPQRLDKPTKFAWQTRLQHLWLAQVIRPALILWHICENLGQKSVGHQDFSKTLGVRTCQTWTEQIPWIIQLLYIAIGFVWKMGTPKSIKILRMVDHLIWPFEGGRITHQNCQALAFTDAFAILADIAPQPEWSSRVSRSQLGLRQKRDDYQV